VKRLHIGLSVANLDESVRFYAGLFGVEPTVVKSDYAKWMLDDPSVNFAISTHGARKGLDHLGIQVENDGELREVYGRLKSAGQRLIEQGETTCCYAKSEKTWVVDPEGIAWETFLTKGDSPVYGSDVVLGLPGVPQSPEEEAAAGRSRASACCA
jgi:catechol 2,3-dioxygenase-like lactoylglutathione lyase family enzyme